MNFWATWCAPFQFVIDLTRSEGFRRHAWYCLRMHALRSGVKIGRLVFSSGFPVPGNENPVAVVS